jgi:DNA-binding response OmpR family regulator
MVDQTGNERARVEVLMLLARGEERHGITGLRMGADDYVVKPLLMADVQARIEALLRRTARQAPPPGDIITICGQTTERVVSQNVDGATPGL